MSDFPLLICDWYRRNKRDLPWRESKNPYFIWLSEIILQQTRVDQGMNYYLKFIKHYPTVSDLALADEQEVLNDWQGLGYYSRARNLHASAKIIYEKYHGIFPNKYEEILNLKGVGTYTAAAISSFAFDLPYAVLDGNVFRVLSRVFDIGTAIDSNEGKKEFSQLAQEILPLNNASEYNQAIMEFGALYCKPTNPDCQNCEINSKCLSFANKTIENRPLKIGKTKIRKRYFYYFILTDFKELIITKRTENDIWKHLFEFPKFEFENEQDLSEIEEKLKALYPFLSLKTFTEKKHILSHQHIFSTFFVLELKDLKSNLKHENESVIKIEDLSDYPLPRLIDRFLENNSDKLFK
ncbi:MAG: A/G-specific adenine glycosylase [Bacteroidota bacterium]